uniref:Uncharacterized protein n=1 Tax=Panagrolaimus davidi TaxID=227884 RepID=A0A914QDU1_9BILA
MRPNIFLLLFFAAVFIFEAAASNCLSSLAPSTKKFVKPKINGPYSRFLDNGKYVIIARDHVTFWLKIPNPHTTELTINFRVVDKYGIGEFNLYIQLFGPDDGCLLQEEAKAAAGQPGSISIDYDCGCELYENGKGESYLLMELWTDKIIYHDMSFEQDGDQLEMYLDEKEAEKWNKMPTCPNIWINKKVMETKINGKEIHGMRYTSELWREQFNGKKLFYQKNGNDYINLDSRDMVMFLERKDVLEKVYVMLELQEGKILNDNIEIKIEVDGAAPDKYYELINGGKGLKIFFKHTECLQVPVYIGLVRYVIQTSIPGMLRASVSL